MKRERLIHERTKRNKTRRVVAEELDISLIYLRKLESGDANPGRDLMFKFSEYYGRGIKILFPDLFVAKDDKKLIVKEAML